MIGLDSLPQTSLLAAFLTGLLSLVSPCALPLVPSYLAYMTGLSLEHLTDSADREKLRKPILLNSLLFIAGFSILFIGFGASASLIGRVLTDHQSLIRKVGGVVIVLFGLHLMGMVKLGFLMTERRLHLRSRPAGYLGSLLIGAACAAAWPPCVGPLLGTLLSYAGTADRLADGVTLLAFYSLGLGLPLVAAAMGVERVFAGFKPLRVYLKVASLVGGLFLILFGLMIYSDSLSLLTSFFERHGIGAYLELAGAT